MPIYEYNCEKCSKHFEITQKISDSPISVCPTCGGKAKRVISQTSFALKGGGWYKDGYGSKKDAKKEEKTDSKHVAKKTDIKKEG